MTTFTIPELYWIAGQGGFTGSGQILMTAFFVRESGGNPTIIGDIDNPRAGCRSYGLGQINVCPGAANAGNKWRENPQLLLNPINNAKACFELSQSGRDFGPWGYGPTAYRSGVTPPNTAAVEAEIRKAGGAVKPSDAALSGMGPIEGQGNVSTGISIPGVPDLGGFSELASRLNDPETWKRVALVVGGTVLAGVAIGVLTQETLHKAIGAVTGSGGAPPQPEEPAITGPAKAPPTAGELDELAMAA